MKIQSIALVVAIVACISSVYAEEDPSNKRPGLLQRRNIGRPGPISKVTSTTAAPAPQEPEYADEEYSEQEYQTEEKQEQQEQETTTTEAPKRITLAVRPFRSNDDLLAALKKRRQQAKLQPKTVTEKQPEFHRIDDEEREATKPQATKSTKASPALKKRTFGNAKSSTKQLSKTVEAEPAIEDPTPSASSPVADRIGRSRFSFNRGARL